MESEKIKIIRDALKKTKFPKTVLELYILKHYSYEDCRYIFGIGDENNKKGIDCE
jgi:hypothetical protein